MQDVYKQTIFNFSPSTRKSHPDTSRIAEEKITKSGRRAAHCDIIIGALSIYNGSTSAELAEHLKGTLTHAQIWRRRKDLVDHKLVRVKGVRDGFGIWWMT